MEAGWPVVLRNLVTASIGVYLLSGAVQGWFFGRLNLLTRALLLAAAVFMIEGGWRTDLIGIGLGLAVFLWQNKMVSNEPLTAAAKPTTE